MATKLDPLYCGYKVKLQTPHYLLVGYITSANNSKKQWFFTNGSYGTMLKDRSKLVVLEATKRTFKETLHLALNLEKHVINALTSTIINVLPNQCIVEPSYATPKGLDDHFTNCKELIKSGSAKEVAQIIQANILNGAKSVVNHHNLNLSIENAAWTISREIKVIVEPWAYELHRELRRLSLIPVMFVKCDDENIYRLSEV